MFSRVFTFKARKASRAFAGNKTRIRCKEGQDNYFALSCRFHLRYGFCLRQQPHGRVSINDNHGGVDAGHSITLRIGQGLALNLESNPSSSCSLVVLASPRQTLFLPVSVFSPAYKQGDVLYPGLVV